MKKKSLDDEMFNAVLEQAFTEAVAEEFADIPDADLQTPDQPKKKRSGKGKRSRPGLLTAVKETLIRIARKTQ